ncbi:GAF domain-containing protein [candidate division CSSED10-310 bacterium]|uniref:GAF domain-containing protein n=1 Tax=candidate division CSSED10-310 bacterium TaxID=2855610 RepID=A0ABV6Z184_UNCC1
MKNEKKKNGLPEPVNELPAQHEVRAEADWLKHLTALKSISAQINLESDLDALLEVIVAQIRVTLPVDMVAFLLHDPEEQCLVLEKSSGFVPEPQPTLKYPENTGVGGYVFQSGQAIVVHDFRNDPRFREPFPAYELQASTLMAVPLLSRQGRAGVLLIGDTGDQTALTEHVLGLLELIAALATIALDNQYLHRRMNRLNREMESLAAENTRKNDEMLQFNKNLKKKINLATKQLHIAYQKLRHREQELNQKVLELISMKEVGEAVSALFDLDIVLRLILNIALGHLKAEQGSVMLIDPASQLLRIKVAQGLSYDVVKKTAIPLGHSIAGTVAQKGEPLLVENIELNDQFQIKKSDQKYKGKSLLCVPLKIKEQVLGVININNKLGGEAFNVKELEILSVFANQAALAIEKAQLQQDIAHAEEVRRVLEKYLSPNVIQKIVDKEITVELGGIQKEITVLFLDIRGFTSLAEKLSPVEMVAFLNKFFGLTTEIIFRYEGTLDKFTGDGLMAIFGAPLDLQNPAVRAVSAALEIIQDTEKNLMLSQLIGNRNFHVGIGINTGPAVAGNIGSTQRMEYTAIGDTVNLAYRLEKSAGPEEIVISEPTYEKVKHVVDIYMEGILTLKGKTEQVKYYVVRAKKEPGKDRGA